MLAAAIASEPAISSALSSYDRQRRPRTQAITQAFRLTAPVGQQLDGRLSVPLRNVATRLAPTHLAVKAVLRYADWTPPSVAGQSAGS